MADILTNILDYYRDNEVIWSLIRDLILIVGLVPALLLWLRALIRAEFDRTTGSIKRDLELREKIEPELSDFVNHLAKNGVLDIEIRFVYWRKYPQIADDDGYAHSIYVKYYDANQPFEASWLNNVGVRFQEHLWYYSQSCYIDQSGIYFFDDEGKEIRDFKEFPNSRIVQTIPYKNIIAYDFKEHLDNEPVFYTRHKSDKWNKLYTNEILIVGRDHTDPRFDILDRRMRMKKFNRLNYFLMWGKCRILGWKSPLAR